MVKAFIFALLLCLPLSILAQSPARPTPPYVASLPTNFAFSKTFTYLPEPPQPNLTPALIKARNFAAQMQGPRPVEIDVTKTGPTRKDAFRFEDGTSQDHWRWGDYRFTTYSAFPNAITVFNPNMVTSKVVEAGDFDELSWVSIDLYSDEEEKQGIKCFVYKQGDETVWIDETSRLPVAYESPTMQIAYTYLSAPNQPLKLPQKFFTKLQQMQAGANGH